MVLQVGEAPIKPEYQLERVRKVDNSGDKRGDNREEGGENKKCKRKKGQNKKRKRPYIVPRTDMLCQFVNRGDQCPWPIDRCKKSHDKKQFLEKKGPDLGERCILFDQFGYCSYSLACRFGSTHIDSNFDNIIDQEKYEKMKIYEVRKTLNRDLQTQLRTWMVNFNQSYSVFEKLKIDYSHELKAQDESRKNREKRKKLDLSTKENNNKCDGKVSEAKDNGADHIETEVTEEYYTLHNRPKKTVEFKGKSFLAPLTTLGNLPFRRICKEYGADITCGEMAICEDLLQGSQPEWALLKRHHTEDIFGVQVCSGNVTKATKTCELINSECDVDFIDLNVGCPIDLVFNRGAGSALMDRPTRLADILRGMCEVSNIPITVKMRIGTTEDKLSAVKLCDRLKSTGVSLITIHGRTRQQRYTKLADWDYISKCREVASPVTLFGNGDILSYEDYNHALTKTEGIMIGRGALIKPWIFKEIKDQQHWDISSAERMEMLKKFTRYGLEHWGTDTLGIEKTRHFLLEWLSFLHRYIPVGVLEVLPQKINQRPPYYYGRDQTETLMCSDNCNDWVKLSEMLVGKVPDGFNFVPKHAANAYS